MTIGPDELLIATAHGIGGEAKYAQTIRVGTHTLVSDEPATHEGADAGPSPYGLVLAGLAACTAITLRMYADRKAWALGEIKVDLVLAREGESLERIERHITIAGELTVDQRARLAEIAEKTPVTRTLKRGTPIVTTFA
jgi:putative redox protein